MFTVWIWLLYFKESCTKLKQLMICQPFDGYIKYCLILLLLEKIWPWGSNKSHKLPGQHKPTLEHTSQEALRAARGIYLLEKTAGSWLRSRVEFCFKVLYCYYYYFKGVFWNCCSGLLKANPRFSTAKPENARLLPDAAAHAPDSGRTSWCCCHGRWRNREPYSVSQSLRDTAN